MSALITAVEELSVFCHWEEDGTPGECFFPHCTLKKADAVSKYLSLVKCIKDKNLQVSNIVGMDFDRPASFSSKIT